MKQTDAGSAITVAQSVPPDLIPVIGIGIGIGEGVTGSRGAGAAGSPAGSESGAANPMVRPSTCPFLPVGNAVPRGC